MGLLSFLIFKSMSGIWLLCDGGGGGVGGVSPDVRIDKLSFLFLVCSAPGTRVGGAAVRDSCSVSYDARIERMPKATQTRAQSFYPCSCV